MVILLRRGATRHVYCVALVRSPRHIVLYAFVALTAHACRLPDGKQGRQACLVSTPVCAAQAAESLLNIRVNCAVRDKVLVETLQPKTDVPSIG